MYIACDTGALFMSSDRGQSWSFIDGRQMRGNGCPVAFYPAGNTIVAWDSFRGLRFADKQGTSWADIPAPQPPIDPFLVVTSMVVTIDSLYLGTGAGEYGFGSVPPSAQRGIYRIPLDSFSESSWQFFPLNENEDVLKLVFIPAQSGIFGGSPAQVACGTSQRVLTVNDGQMSWAPLPVQPTMKEGDLIRGFNAVGNSSPFGLPLFFPSIYFYVTVGDHALGGNRTFQTLATGNPFNLQWRQPS